MAFTAGLRQDPTHGYPDDAKDGDVLLLLLLLALECYRRDGDSCDDNERPLTNTCFSCNASSGYETKYKIADNLWQM